MKKSIKLTLVYVVIAVLLLSTALSFYFIGRNSRKKIMVPIDNNVQNIYVTFGTLPILYSILHIMTHSEPSYVYFGRVDTFDVTKLPKNAQLIVPQNVDYNPSQIVNFTIDAIHDIEQKNDQPFYNFFVDDLRVLLPFRAFFANNIPKSRFSITLLSDGSASYSGIFDPIVGPNGESSFIQNGQKLQDILQAFEQNNSGENSVTDGEILESYLYAYQAAQFSNVEYWMQYPEFAFLSDDVLTSVKTELLTATLVKKQPLDILNKLSKYRREAFFDGTLNNSKSFSKDDFDKIFLQSEKPVMLISGTHIGNGKNPENFDDAVDAVIDSFGQDYNIMLKPHPAQNIHDAQFDKTREKGITILPAQLPMEVLMWAYPDLSIGGYQSTLYMATLQSQVAFFFESFEQGGFPSGGITLRHMKLLYEYGFFSSAKMLTAKQ
ncbi:MAG: hypothetical protein LBU60_01060 [Clostridiales bacterium]|jgi:hypothetical protein|nr:hypothetical protein [Clostridiales bacterium]